MEQSNAIHCHREWPEVKRNDVRNCQHGVYQKNFIQWYVVKN